MTEIQKIHLEFMKAALTGSYAMCANPIVEERISKYLDRNRSETAEQFHATFALEAANAALELYLNRWPELRV